MRYTIYNKSMGYISKNYGRSYLILFVVVSLAILTLKFDEIKEREKIISQLEKKMLLMEDLIQFID